MSDPRHERWRQKRADWVVCARPGCGVRWQRTNGQRVNGVRYHNGSCRVMAMREAHHRKRLEVFRRELAKLELLLTPREEARLVRYGLRCWRRGWTSGLAVVRHGRSSKRHHRSDYQAEAA